MASAVEPSLGAFVLGTLPRGDSVSTYTECANALVALHAQDEKTKEGTERQLVRLMQHGVFTIGTVEPLIRAIQAVSGKESKEDKQSVRAGFYLLQLAFGDGSAGTPLPVSSQKASTAPPKAVDRFGPETLAAAWADLANERTPFMRKQGALRALAALAHASLTSKPDDPTYPAGVFVTLQSLLERIEELRASKNSLTNVLQQQKLAAGSASMRRKNMVTEFRKSMETWGLMRLAFSAARIALSRSGLLQIASKSFTGITSGDSVCARHALALAALAARDPQGAGVYISEVGPRLRQNVEMSKRLGLLYSRATAGPGAAKAASGLLGVAAPPPAVMRDDPETHLNLKDPWARIYLARGCAAALQSGYIAGDVQNSGAPFWEALASMACADPSDMVALEAVRSMFGAPPPHPEPLRRRPGYQENDLETAAQAKVYGASWHMVMSMADVVPDLPEASLHPVHPSLVLHSSQGGHDGQSKSAPLFVLIASRLLHGFQSRSRALIATSCRTAAVILEARAWCMALSGGSAAETDSVRRALRVLQGNLTAVFASEGLGALERSAAAEALVWLQSPPVEDGRSMALVPAQLFRAASQGALGVQPVVKALFADPWPEALALKFQATLQRRMRATPALAPWVMQLSAALAAATPGSLPCYSLQALWEAAPGQLALQSGLEMAATFSIPLADTPAAASVEVKALAASEETAYEELRALAAWWLGEHAQNTSGVFAWKPSGKASIVLPFLTSSVIQNFGLPSHSHLSGPKLKPSGRMAVAATAFAPLMALVIAHLQRIVLTGSWELRVCALQALGKLAIRSPEPFRIQAYTLLRMAGSGVGGGEGDPLGLAAVAHPILEVVDALYAGEQVLAAQVLAHGPEASSWSPTSLSALQRRHDWLVAMIMQRVCSVPKDFFPLGLRSRRLLRPDDVQELDAFKEGEDEGEDGRVLDAAAAAAAATAGGADTYFQQEDEALQYYDAEGNLVQADYEADPLANWKAGSDQLNNVAAVAWRGLDAKDDDLSYSAGLGDMSSAADEDDSRLGVMLYDFKAGGEEEISVRAGERLRLTVDMGDWCHVTTSSGAHGLVPSSYVQLDDITTAASEPSAPSPRSRLGASTQSQYLVAENMGNGFEAYMGGVDDYATGAAAYAAYDNTGLEENEAPLYGKGGGGFDDFGAALAAAAEARARGAAQQAATPVQQQQQQSVSQQTFSRSSTASSISIAGASNAVIQNAYATAIQTTLSTTSSLPDIGVATTTTASTTWVAQDEVLQATQYAARQSMEDPGMQAAGADASGWASSEVAGLRPALAMYSFSAELDNELTIHAGDVLQLGPEVDGWYQATRGSDGATGLVPAGYVSLLENAGQQ